MLHKFQLNGHGQAVRIGFQANTPANQHALSIPGLEFAGGNILPFHQISKLTALGSLGEGLAHVRLSN